jgi:spore maturation protein CgeB
MHFVIFCHSLTSDWSHAHAHFLRGIVGELQAGGHTVDTYEPEDGWSRRNLLLDQGQAAVVAFATRFPNLRSRRYRPGGPDLDRALANADVVLVHEWTDAALVSAIGAHHASHDHYRLLYHDTHHRSVSNRAGWEATDLGGYDAALVAGRSLADVYARRASIRRVYVWHEAADTRVFQRGARGGLLEPRTGAGPRIADLVWVGNWGEDERAAELEEFLLAPVRDLGLEAAIYGVRYPTRALVAVERAGAEYRGYLPNHAMPAAFARARLTVHIPRRIYATALPGIPTIRPFEALACGIPLVSAPWDDVEHLFEPGRDFLIASSGAEMKEHISTLLYDPARARALAEHGHATVMARHTCAHRVAELMEILRDLAVREAA